jgi:DNA-binding transcriptional MocR family regulator
MKEMPNYYAIIPGEVRYDTNLKDKAKLLYGEITALSDKNGYCYASNRYFAELYNVSQTTISLLIKNLVDSGYIENEIVYKEGSKEILNRYLKIIKGGYLKNLKEGYLKKVKDNNTRDNNTSNNKKENTKRKYGEYKNVLLTDDEYNRLKNDYNNYEELIRFLDEYIEMKGYKAKSHNLAIRKWVVDAVNEYNKKHQENKLPNWFDKNMEKDLKNLNELNDILKDFN